MTELFYEHSPSGWYENAQNEDAVGVGIHSESAFYEAAVKGLAEGHEWASRNPLFYHTEGLKALHLRCFFECDTRAGIWRDKPFRYLSKASPPYQIISEIELLCDQESFLRTTTCSPEERLAAIAYVHLRLLYIAPFLFGNSMLARLILAEEISLMFGVSQDSFLVALSSVKDEYDHAVLEAGAEAILDESQANDPGGVEVAKTLFRNIPVGFQVKEVRQNNIGPLCQILSDLIRGLTGDTIDLQRLYSPSENAIYPPFVVLPLEDFPSKGWEDRWKKSILKSATFAILR